MTSDQIKAEIADLKTKAQQAIDSGLHDLVWKHLHDGALWEIALQLALRNERVGGILDKSELRNLCRDCGHAHAYDSICGMLLSDREPDGEHFCHCDRPEGFDDPEPDPEGWPRISPRVGGWAVFLHPKAEAVMFETEEGAKTYIQGIGKLMNDYTPPDKPHTRWFCKACRSCRRHCNCPTAQGYELTAGECLHYSTGQPYFTPENPDTRPALKVQRPARPENGEPYPAQWLPDRMVVIPDVPPNPAVDWDLQTRRRLVEVIDAAAALVQRLDSGRSPFPETDTVGNIRWQRLSRAVANVPRLP